MERADKLGSVFREHLENGKKQSEKQTNVAMPP